MLVASGRRWWPGIAMLFTSLLAAALLASPGGERIRFPQDVDLGSISSVRAAIASMEQESRRLRKRGPLSADMEHSLEERTSFYEGRLHLLMMRALPGDRIDQDRYWRAVEHRRTMPTPVGVQAAGGSWTFLGPRSLDVFQRKYNGLSPVNGRANTAVYDPNNPSRIWLGGATGGLFRSTDGGLTWTNFSDKWDFTYVTEIAVDPANSNRVYVATGDYNGWWGFGMGVMKTTDGGATWQNVLRDQLNGAEVSDIMVMPGAPNVVIAGSGRGSENGRAGVWVSTDFGLNWTRKTQSGAISDLSVSQPKSGVRRVYAVGDYGINSNNAWFSDDNGATWTRMDVPGGATPNVLAVQASPVEPDTVYLLHCGAEQVYRSLDRGQTWGVISIGFPFPGSRTWDQKNYDFFIGVARRQVPTPGDFVFVGLVGLHARDMKSGSWFSPGSSLTDDATIHCDFHGFSLHPTDPTRFLIANDGGLYAGQILFNGTTNLVGFVNRNAGLRISEHVWADAMPNKPNSILTGIWHNGTGWSANNLNDWGNVSGGDGMATIIDPSAPTMQFTTTQNLGRGDGDEIRVRYTRDEWSGQDIATVDFETADTPAFVAPLADVPGAAGEVYVGSQYLYRLKLSNTIPFESWPERGSRGRIASGDDRTTALTSPPSLGTYVFAGTSSGLLRRSLGALLPFATIEDFDGAISSISIHPTDPNRILVTLGGGGLYVSSNGLAANPTFARVTGTGSGTLPDIGFNWIERDPNDPTRTWYLASDVGVFYTKDAGLTWYNAGEPLGLPNTMCMHLRAVGGYLYASTFGRGVWRMPLFASGPVLTFFDIPNPQVYGRNAVQAEVRLNRSAPPEGVTIQILSDNQAVVKDFPLVIPPGASSRVFSIPTLEINQTKNVTIRARYMGSEGVEPITVLPYRVTAINMPATVTSGNNVPITILLNAPAPSGGMQVALANSHPTLIQVPAKVTVPAGQTSFTFSFPSRITGTDTDVTVTCTKNNVRTDTVRLLSLRISSLTLTPESVYNGGLLTMRIALNRAAPTGGVTVALQTSNQAVAPPTSIVIPAGAIARDTLVSTSLVTSVQTATVQGAITGSSASDTATVRPLRLSSVSVSPNPTRFGQRTTGTVILSEVPVLPVPAIRISSSNPRVLGVPTFANHVPGTNRATFALTPGNVLTTTPVTVTASLSSQSVTARVAVAP